MSDTLRRCSPERLGVERLRRGFCPLCGINIANTKSNGDGFVELGYMSVPKCCCLQCRTLAVTTLDSTWRKYLCINCPLKGQGCIV